MHRAVYQRRRIRSGFEPASQYLGVRAGYTMIELLLVLAVVTVIMAVAWPNVMRISSQQQLTDSGERVRSVASSARVHAIDKGLVYQFRYELGGTHFLVVPFEREFEGVSPNARGTGTAAGLGKFSKASGTLPKGVTFAAPTLLNPGTAGGAAVTTAGQRLNSTVLSGLPDASKLENLSWSGPILFQPDGSAADASLDLVDKRNQRVTIHIRGVTGAISVTRIHQAQRR
ncbi:MAG: prepilin-type N-terminal cleavage/methylation domain-containing protein [Planctomycetes bacterium]|nr:prepilin-type N-terminal cleavage/methylation domain-containing protein [Planctomycetota bacterium]